MSTSKSVGRSTGVDDRLNLDWFIDRGAQVLIFLGGISAIVLIIAEGSRTLRRPRPTD